MNVLAMLVSLTVMVPVSVSIVVPSLLLSNTSIPHIEICSPVVLLNLIALALTP